MLRKKKRKKYANEKVYSNNKRTNRKWKMDKKKILAQTEKDKNIESKKEVIDKLKWVEKEREWSVKW